MTLSRTFIAAVLGAAALTTGTLATGGALALQAAHARAPVSLDLVSASGQCTVTWKKDGVAFEPLAPGDVPGSFAMTGGTGTVSFDLAALTDPVALARSMRIEGTFKGGFTYTDPAGRTVEVSDGQYTLPVGSVSYLVKSPAAPAGVRMTTHVYDGTAAFEPTVTSVMPPKVGVRTTGLTTNITPEFAQVLNDTFGPGSVTSGAPVATCTGSATT
ncbi:hypothetical protein [Streptomyces huiliensis]|uniref:hypothetical protein n=1 Tax=Streptomyces huiliensis TaxID=2876027 RepID=UPI001CBF4B74|nr:hypothetical protein [Streptomyces huiliensis]MBZ4320497.1 hypothetical protein [Streptomyces huiliensis]